MSKRTCQGCIYQYKDHTRIIKSMRDLSKAPNICISCYMWTTHNAIRKNYSNKKVYRNCNGCIYEDTKANNYICISCYTWNDDKSIRNNYVPFVCKSNELVSFIDDIIDDI